MNSYVRPTRSRHVEERSRYIWEGVDSQLSPQLNQNPNTHTHANSAQTSCKYIWKEFHIPQEAYMSLLPLCLLSSLIWDYCCGLGGMIMEEREIWKRNHDSIDIITFLIIVYLTIMAEGRGNITRVYVFWGRCIVRISDRRGWEWMK